MVKATLDAGGCRSNRHILTASSKFALIYPEEGELTERRKKAGHERRTGRVGSWNKSKRPSSFCDVIAAENRVFDWCN